VDEAFAGRLRSGRPQSAAGTQHRQLAPRRRGPSLPGVSPPGPRKRNSWSGPGTCAAAAQILLLVPQRRLHAPYKRLPRDKGHQRKDGTGATSRQPQSCRAHISTTPSAIQPRPRSASTTPRIPTPRGGTNRTSPTPTPQQQNIHHHPHHPQAPKQEDFTDQPYRGVIHMITGGPASTST
jgi:hypothetical protein